MKLIKHIANLARIELNDKEIKKYQQQLGDILGYVEKLNQVKTDNIETAVGGTRDLYNIWREDEVKTQNSINKIQDLIDMAPEVERGQVKVGKVF